MTATIQINVESTLKDQAAVVLGEIGMTMDDVITAVLTRVVRDHQFPVELCEPNAETMEAIAELRRGEGTRYNTTEEMFADMENW